VAAAGVAQVNRELVADEFAATAGENDRKDGETRPLLLAADGRKPPRLFGGMLRRIAGLSLPAG